MTSTALYRHFDSDGQLLYVGISIDALARMGQHMGAAKWREKIASMTLERFPTRAQALTAEKAAIISERPVWNIVYNRAVAPKRAGSKMHDGAEALTHADEWLPELGASMRRACALLKCLARLSGNVSHEKRSGSVEVSGVLRRRLLVLSDRFPNVVSLETPPGGVEFHDGRRIRYAGTAIMFGVEWRMASGAWKLFFVDAGTLRQRLEYLLDPHPEYASKLDADLAQYHAVIDQARH